MLGIDLIRRFGRISVKVVESLEVVSDSVVGHVNRTVRQGFNHPHGIPWKVCSQTKLSRTGPFFQPSNRVFIPAQSVRVVRIEVVAQDVFLDRLGPRFFSVGQIPLIGRRDDTFVVGSADDSRFRFEIKTGLTRIDHFLFDDGFGLAHLLPGVWTVRHDTNGETLQVGLILSLGEFRLVVGRFDLELLAHELCGGVTVTFDRNNRYDLKRKNHLFGNSKLRTEVRLVLQGLKRNIIIRSVTRNRSDNPGSLEHANCQQRKGVYLFVFGKGCLEWKPKQVVSLESFETFDLSELLGVTLVVLVDLARQTTGRSRTHDENLIRRIDGVRSIIALGQDKAIGLTVHGFGTKSCWDQKYFLVTRRFEQFSHLGVSRTLFFDRQDLQLDQDVFLRSNTFSFRPIVIGANLSINQGENVVAFSEQNLVLFAEGFELPANEGIVIRINSRRNERSAPIDTGTKISKVFNSDRREVFQPMVWVDELRDFFNGNHLGQNIPLSHNTLSCLLYQLGFSAFCFGIGCRRRGFCGSCGSHFRFHLFANLRIVFRKLWRNPERRDFRLEFVGGRLNGHARTVKGKREQDILSLVAFVLGPENSLGQRKGVSDVQMPVAVRVGEGYHKGLFFRTIVVVLRIPFEGTFGFPFLLDRNFVDTEGVSLCGSLRSGWATGYRQSLHCLRGGFRCCGVGVRHGAVCSF
mmetsp:Transcript_19660/g.44897  ORF Transcript_19660/g.44897 Transcript_19660/m.44897 type:complete len:689 (-) Transcript_19660:85-2151(-)